MDRFGNRKLSQLNDEEAVRAVEYGLKPVAYVNQQCHTDLPFISFQLPYVKLCAQGERVEDAFLNTEYVYYQPGQHAAAERVKELILVYNQPDFVCQPGDRYEPLPRGEHYHREMGQLLGYSAEEIENFVRET